MAGCSSRNRIFGSRKNTKSWILDPDPQYWVAKLSGGLLKLERWVDKLVMCLAFKAFLLAGFEPLHFLNAMKFGTEAKEHGDILFTHQKIL